MADKKSPYLLREPDKLGTVPDECRNGCDLKSILRVSARVKLHFQLSVGSSFSYKVLPKTNNVV